MNLKLLWVWIKILIIIRRKKLFVFCIALSCLFFFAHLLRLPQNNLSICYFIFIYLCVCKFIYASSQFFLIAFVTLSIFFIRYVVSIFIIFLSYVFFVLHNKSILQFYKKEEKKKSECFFDGMLLKVSFQSNCPPMMLRPRFWEKGVVFTIFW